MKQFLNYYNLWMNWEICKKTFEGQIVNITSKPAEQIVWTKKHMMQRVKKKWNFFTFNIFCYEMNRLIYLRIVGKMPYLHQILSFVDK